MQQLHLTDAANKQITNCIASAKVACPQSSRAARYDLLQCTVGHGEREREREREQKDTKNSRGEGGSSGEFNFNVGLNHHRIQICFTVSYAKAKATSSSLLLSWLLVPLCPSPSLSLSLSLSLFTLHFGLALTDKTADKRGPGAKERAITWPDGEGSEREWIFIIRVTRSLIQLHCLSRND